MKNFHLFLLLYLFYASAHAQDLNAHPEKGMLPFNAPCKDCIEELGKRTSNTREFYTLKADHSKTIYIQKSYGGMNMKDANGYWRTVDPRLMPEGENVYAARMQPSPVVLDLGNKVASITNNGYELRFNKNLSLVHIDVNGHETTFGEPDYSRVTRTENVTETHFLVSDFYPGIDLQIITGQGRVKTNFILKQRMPLNGGSLVLRQQLEIPSGLHADYSGSTETGQSRFTGEFNLSDIHETHYFTFLSSHAWDAKENWINNIELAYSLNGDVLDYIVPVSWLNETSTAYPVTIDPIVSSTRILPQAQITGSGFTTSGSCDQDGCSYFLDSVMTPPDCEITGIECYFAYLANLPCIRDDGGFDITMTNPNGMSCTSRNFTCLGGIQGSCFFWPVQLMNAVPPLGPCLLPTQCASYPLDFELRLRRCNWIPIVPCDATCILANSDWTITIVGNTAEITNLIPDQTICEGTCVDLQVSMSGAQPITVTWSPGNLTGNPVTVCPTVSTGYIAIASDQCGTTDTISTFITVHPFQAPTFTISPNDTICINDQIQFSASGNAPASSYDWSIQCQGNFVFNDVQNLTFTSTLFPGPCDVSLNYSIDTSGHTCFGSITQPFVIDNCLGIGDPGKIISSIVYNPSASQVQIRCTESSNAKNLQLINMLGEVSTEKKNVQDRDIAIDVTGYPSGIYFVAVTSGNQKGVYKIILY